MSEIRLKFSRFLHSVSTYANGRSQARLQHFTSSLHQKTEMIIDIIRIYSYCHEQNLAIPTDGKIVLSFFMRGYLLSPFSLIVRSFGQVSFGRLAKIRSVVWPRSVRSFGQIGTLLQSFFQIHLFRLASVAYIIRYMSLQPVGEVEVVEVDGDMVL